MKPSDPVELLQTLIRCPSVTPAAAPVLDALESILRGLGFTCHRQVFCEAGTPDVDNLYAKIGDGRPHLMFAGHVDVVPPGETSHWKHPPFSAEIDGGLMFGRGAVDMKGAIATFVAAVARLLENDGKVDGSISLLITGDEEGPSINGSAKLLEWAAAKGEKWDGAVVGEPTNPSALGDMIKIGRRGSVSGRILVNGVQGHSAYPHLADNPVNGLMDLLDSLLVPPFDEGSDNFQPSNLEIVSVDVGNPAMNVIPAKAAALFNIRFNDLWDADSLKREINRRLEAGATSGRYRRRGADPVSFSVEWTKVSHGFLTHDDKLVGTLGDAIVAVTGRRPELSTSGGTSDARFIKDYCPVIDFGLVGQTMHKVDECVALEDLERLTEIYRKFIVGWFAAVRT